MELAARLRQAGVTGIEVVHGTAGTVACSTLPDADFVVSAIVGVAGLEATHAAILAGKPVGPGQQGVHGGRRRDPYPRRP
jgi:1-deoxy-D-xylulose-5-phosphate reductoisomerase